MMLRGGETEALEKIQREIVEKGPGKTRENLWIWRRVYIAIADKIMINY